jgi:hypothetical protein
VRCSGAASARGDIGCSTSEKRSAGLVAVDHEAHADAAEEALARRAGRRSSRCAVVSISLLSIETVVSLKM